MSDDLVEHLTALLATAIDVNERLTNERDRLREALEEIDMRGLQYNPEDLADIARAALKGESHE